MTEMKVTHHPPIEEILETELRRSPALAVVTRGQCDEIERLRRLEDLIIANRDRLEAGDKHAVAQVLRFIEFNPRPPGVAL